MVLHLLYTVCVSVHAMQLQHVYPFVCLFALTSRNSTAVAIVQKSCVAKGKVKFRGGVTEALF